MVPEKTDTTLTASAGISDYNDYPAPSKDVVASPNYNYYNPLRDIVCSYLPLSRICEIDKGFLIADRAHDGQKRASGEPYIIHPIAVASIIARMHLDVESVIAALLHDVVEDTFITEADVEKEFGSTVRQIVYGVTKLDKLRFHDYREAQAENFRKMILAMTGRKLPQNDSGYDQGY